MLTDLLVLAESLHLATLRIRDTHGNMSLMVGRRKETFVRMDVWV